MNSKDFASRGLAKTNHKKASLNLSRKWFSRAKGQWLLDGERNSKFFHRKASYKHKIILINSFLIDGVMCYDKKKINEDAKKFLCGSFQQRGER